MMKRINVIKLLQVQNTYKHLRLQGQGTDKAGCNNLKRIAKKFTLPKSTTMTTAETLGGPVRLGSHGSAE